MKLRTPVVSLLLGMAPFAVQAASLVEIQNQHTLSKFYSEGQNGHMDVGDGNYMVINGDRIYFVQPDEKLVLDMSDSMGQGAPTGDAPEVNAKLVPQGSGPKIAGYSTQKIGYTANGKSCGTLFTSKAAMKDAGMEHMLSVMRKMAKQAAGRVAQFGGMQDPCDVADSQLMDRFSEVGMPLRSIGRDGEVQSEVLRVVKRATPPPNAFTYPKNYQVRNMAQMEQQAHEQMRSGMPNMEELMKHMPKEGGGMPPEAAEQMNKLKEMMKQYQRQ